MLLFVCIFIIPKHKHSTYTNNAKSIASLYSAHLKTLFKPNPYIKFLGIDHIGHAKNNDANASQPSCPSIKLKAGRLRPQVYSHKPTDNW